MQADVLILGAGPAGSALARQLAGEGFSVVIADKKAFPRQKPCGEFLSPECLPYLAELGLGGMLEELGAQRVLGMRLSGYGRAADGSFRQLDDRPGHGRSGYGIRRERFDHHLLRAAEASGAHFLPRHEFVSLQRDAGGRVTGAMLKAVDGAPVAVTAKHVVGADGVHSRVAKALGVQRKIGWLSQFALVAHFAGVPSRPRADVHLLPGGFFAATTVDEGLYSLNLVLPQQAFGKRTAADWDAFVEGYAAQAPALAERLQGGTRLAPWRGCGPFGFRTTTPTLPGAWLCGDAAGYVDPLTGEGIYFALFGARALGTQLAASLHEPASEAKAMAAYRAARKRELAPRMAASKLLQRAIRHPWLVGPFLGMLGRWPGLADLLVTMTGDTVHPRELWRPGFWRTWNRAAMGRSA